MSVEEIEVQLKKVNELEWPDGIRLELLVDSCEPDEIHKWMDKLDCVPYKTQKEPTRRVGFDLKPYGSDYLFLLNDYPLFAFERKKGLDAQSSLLDGRFTSQVDKMVRLMGQDSTHKPDDPFPARQRIYFLEEREDVNSRHYDAHMTIGMKTSAIVKYRLGWITTSSKLETIFFMMKMVSKIHSNCQHLLPHVSRFRTFNEYKTLIDEVKKKPFEFSKKNEVVSLSSPAPSNTDYPIHRDEILEFQSIDLSKPRRMTPRAALLASLTSVLSERQSYSMSLYFWDMDHFMRFLTQSSRQDVMDFLSRLPLLSVPSYYDEDMEADRKRAMDELIEGKGIKRTLGPAIVRSLFTMFLSDENTATLKPRTDKQLRDYLRTKDKPEFESLLGNSGDGKKRKRQMETKKDTKQSKKQKKSSSNVFLLSSV